LLCAQAAPAKAAFWDTHCDPSTANGRNGGAHLAFLEELLKANSSGYMVGAGLTAADLCVFDIVDLLLRVYPDQLPSAVSPWLVMLGIGACRVYMYIHTCMIA
jgi:glutathione S-transferase